jgi:hypothetical protein
VADPVWRARLSGTAATRRRDYAYDIRDRQFIAKDTSEFYNGETLVGKIDTSREILSLKRAEGQNAVNANRPNQEHKGWDEYEFIDGNVGPLRFYSVDDKFENVLTDIPAQFADAFVDVDQTFHTYRIDTKTGEAKRSGSGFLNKWGHSLSDIVPDPLFTPDSTSNRWIINVIDYRDQGRPDNLLAEAENQYKTRSPIVRTYNYDPYSHTMDTVMQGDAVLVDQRRFVDLTSNAIATKLDDPSVSARQISNARNGRAWLSFFDPVHEAQPLARIEGVVGAQSIHIPTYKQDLPKGNGNMQQGDPKLAFIDKEDAVSEDTYELLGTVSPQIGNKTFEGPLVTDQAFLTTLANNVDAEGYREIAQALRGKVLAYETRPLYYPKTPGAPQKELKRTVAVFNRYQQIAKIEFRTANEFRDGQIVSSKVVPSRLSLTQYDTTKPWVERAGVDYDYTNQKIGMVLAASVSLNNPELESQGIRPVHVWNRRLNVMFTEFRDVRHNGIVLYKEEGTVITPASWTHADVGRSVLIREGQVVTAVKSRNWAAAQASITSDYRKYVLLKFKYGAWNPADWQKSGPIYSAPYLMGLGTPIETESYLFEPRVGGTSEDDVELSKVLASNSRVVNIEAEEGIGMHVYAFRHSETKIDANVLRTDRIEVTAADENEQGVKRMIIYGTVLNDPSDFKARVQNFREEKIFCAFIMGPEMGADAGPNYASQVADKTATFDINVDHPGEISLFEKANSTSVGNDGSVMYKVVRGVSSGPVVFPANVKNSFARYQFLKRNIKTMRIDGPQASLAEIKTGAGVLEASIDGFLPDDIRPDGFVKDIRKGKHFNVLYYDRTKRSAAALFHESIPDRSERYHMKNGSVDRQDYTVNELIGSKTNLVFTKDKYGRYIMRYKAHSTEEGEAFDQIEVGSYGLDVSKSWIGEPGADDRIKLMFNRQMLPSHTVGITGGREELLRKFQYAIVQSESDHRYLILVEYDPGEANVWKFIRGDSRTSWIVYKDGAFLARWDGRLMAYKTDENPTALNLGDDIRNSAALRSYVRPAQVNEAEIVIAAADRGEAVLNDVSNSNVSIAAPAGKAGFRPVTSAEPVPAAVAEAPKTGFHDAFNTDEINDLQSSRWSRVRRFLAQGEIVGVVLGGIWLAAMAGWHLLARWSNNGRHGVAAIAVGLRNFVLWRRPVAHVNEATQESLEEIFTRAQASEVLRYRAEHGVILDVNELRPILMKRTGMTAQQFERAAGRLSVTPVGPRAENQTPDLRPLQQQMVMFERTGLLTKGQINAVVARFDGFVERGLISPERHRQRVLRELYREALWDSKGAPRQAARDLYEREIKKVFETYGFEMSDFENHLFAENLVKEAFADVPMELISMPTQTPEAGESALFFLADGEGLWRPVPLERYIIDNVLSTRYLPFMTSDSTVLRWYGREISRLMRAGRTPAQIRTFMRRHEKFWYQVLHDQLEDKLETNRDMSTPGLAMEDMDAGLWQFLVNWADMDDVFRYVLGESDMETIDGPLPVEVANDPKFIEARGRVNTLLRRVGEGVFEARAGEANKNLSSQVIQRLVENDFQPLLNAVRNHYGLFKIRTAGGELRMHGYVIGKLMDPRFFRTPLAGPFFKVIATTISAAFAWRIGATEVLSALPVSPLALFGASITIAIIISTLSVYLFTIDRTNMAAWRLSLLWGGVTVGAVGAMAAPFMQGLGYFLFGSYAAVAAMSLVLSSLYLRNRRDVAAFNGFTSLRQSRATFFWSMVTLVSFAFAGFISVFLIGTVIFMPVPFANLSPVFVAFPMWTRALFLLLSFRALPDMFFLTFFGVANLGKGAVRIFIGRHFNLAEIRQWEPTFEHPRVSRPVSLALVLLAISSMGAIGPMSIMTMLLVAVTVGGLYFVQSGAKTRSLSMVEAVPLVFSADRPERLDVFKIISKVWNKQAWLSDDEYEAIGKAIESLKAATPKTRPAALGGMVAALRSVEMDDARVYIVEWMNKFLETDIPSNPRNYAELGSVTDQLAAFGESPYFEFSDFNKLAPGALETQLGMLARGYPQQFKLIVHRLEQRGLANANQLEELRLLATNSDHVLSAANFSLNNPQHVPVIEMLEEWFNLRTQAYYANLRGAAETRIVYEYYVRKFFPDADDATVQRLVDAKFQVTAYHPGVIWGDMGLLNFLRRQTGHHNWELSEFLHKLRTGEVEFPDEPAKDTLMSDTNPGAKYAGKVGGYSYRAMKKYVELLTGMEKGKVVSNNTIELLDGPKLGISDVQTGKYVTWRATLPYVRGRTVIAMDTDHRHPIHESWMAPNVAREFMLDPNLAIGVYTGDIFTSPLSPAATAFGKSERWWLHGEQMAKRFIGRLSAYGKFVYRRQMVLDHQALPAHLVAEDAGTGTRLLQYGFATTHLPYFKPGKGLGNQLGGAYNPLRKWSGDAPESIFDINFQKFLLSPNVHWTVKVDALVSYYFYLKKIAVRRVTEQVLEIFYFLNLNPWFGLPHALWVNSVVTSQAIGYGGWITTMEEKGRIRGTVRYLLMLAWPVFAFATAITPLYANAVAIGAMLLTSFKRTGGKGGAVGRASFDELYIQMQKSIMPGFLLSVLVFGLSSFDSIKFIIWLPQILTVTVGWWMGSFLLNAAMDKPNSFQRNVPRSIRAMLVSAAVALVFLGGFGSHMLLPLGASSVSAAVIGGWAVSAVVVVMTVVAQRDLAWSQRAMLAALAVGAGYLGGPVGALITFVLILSSGGKNRRENLKHIFIAAPAAVVADALNNLPSLLRIVGLPLSMLVRSQRTIPNPIRTIGLGVAGVFVFVQGATFYAIATVVLVSAVALIEHFDFEPYLRDRYPSFSRMFGYDDRIYRGAITAMKLAGDIKVDAGKAPALAVLNAYAGPAQITGHRAGYPGLFNALSSMLNKGPVHQNPSLIHLWKVRQATKSVMAAVRAKVVADEAAKEESARRNPAEILIQAVAKAELFPTLNVNLNGYVEPWAAERYNLLLADLPGSFDRLRQETFSEVQDAAAAKIAMADRYLWPELSKREKENLLASSAGDSVEAKEAAAKTWLFDQTAVYSKKLAKVEIDSMMLFQLPALAEELNAQDALTYEGEPMPLSDRVWNDSGVQAVKEELIEFYGNEDAARTAVLDRFAQLQPTANAAKGYGVHSAADHEAVNKIVQDALLDGRGQLIQGAEQEVKEKWVAGSTADAEKLQAAVALLQGQAPFELSDNLGLLDVREQLSLVNVVLINPKEQSPPALYFKNARAFQVSHPSAKYNTIYIDAITFKNLKLKELAALLFHDAIDMAGKQRTLGKRAIWTNELATSVHEFAVKKEIDFIGAGQTRGESHLDDAIKTSVLTPLITADAKRVRQILKMARDPNDRERDEIAGFLNGLEAADRLPLGLARFGSPLAASGRMLTASPRRFAHGMFLTSFGDAQKPVPTADFVNGVRPSKNIKVFYVPEATTADGINDEIARLKKSLGDARGVAVEVVTNVAGKSVPNVSFLSWAAFQQLNDADTVRATSNGRADGLKFVVAQGAWTPENIGERIALMNSDLGLQMELGVLLANSATIVRLSEWTFQQFKRYELIATQA